MLILQVRFVWQVAGYTYTYISRLVYNGLVQCFPFHAIASVATGPTGGTAGPENGLLWNLMAQKAACCVNAVGAVAMIILAGFGAHSVACCWMMVKISENICRPIRQSWYWTFREHSEHDGAFPTTFLENAASLTFIRVTSVILTALSCCKSSDCVTHVKNISFVYCHQLNG